MTVRAIYREIAGRIIWISAGQIHIELTEPKRCLWIPRRQLLHTPHISDTTVTVHDRWLTDKLGERA